MAHSIGFDAVLVANRGEIACRIIKTACALGLKTVAVFSDADRGAPHVRMADHAVRLGPAPAAGSYLRGDAIIEAALAAGAEAVHPGYGFLSEDGSFARAVEAEGLLFVGPTPAQLELFGVKHAARQAAAEVGVPLLPGSGLLASAEEAVASAEALGFPVMLKATGGGGGIGLQRCLDAKEVATGFETVRRVAQAGFRSGGIYLERLVTAARHVEVQVFGDGTGGVVVLGDRDCSLQRRQQKVIEETPAPALPAEVRDALASHSARLAESVCYRSAGTVEFLYDAARQEVAFLEVNARLQVEHPVTEAVWGLDLVAAMLRLAGGDRGIVGELRALRPSGHAVEARLYAEDPAKDYQPSPGLITTASFPGGVRVDTWIESGTEVTSAYDPLLAKVIVWDTDRSAALDGLAQALSATRVDGIETNLELLHSAITAPEVWEAVHTTSTLSSLTSWSARIDVLRAGTQTTVQDWPGRLGYWHVGVPPSGPMDSFSFRLANKALSNEEGAPALEITLSGPALRPSAPTTFCVTGAPAEVRVDGRPVPMWTAVNVPAGAVLDIGAVGPPGLRTYLSVSGGFDVPRHLGSSSTFALGGFGGHAGRALRAGDVLRRVTGVTAVTGVTGVSGVATVEVPLAERPEITDAWTLTVMPGPHADDEFFTDSDRDEFYSSAWTVHFNSARTGVRLKGPRPRWARPDGGEAGLHPSNIHDTPYAVGAVDYTGDLPILLGPDGPSLGGFVCPATVVSGELWKLGQLRPGDQVRFTQAPQEARDSGRRPRSPARFGILTRTPAGSGPEVTYRANGDENLLVEFGPMTLDLSLRARVHVLAEALARSGTEGIIDLTPGVRSLQIHVEPRILPIETLMELVADLESRLPPDDALEVPSREVHLPLSWDDPATRKAIERYMTGVRSDAPWCPSNIEFIRRVNGLGDVEEVYRIVHQASYLVLGLGDVYLGAPLATPVDPRHRLVTTKYNPARTWTAENSVGIGGAYLCIYGMEGPGGYQFVGRTVQVWSRFQQRAPFESGTPWLLRFFDRIRWYPVTAEELLDARADMAAARYPLRIVPGIFRLADHNRMLEREAVSIAAFRERQAAAFAAERKAWQTGEFDVSEGPVVPAGAHLRLPAGAAVVESPMTASVWQLAVRPGDRVCAGQSIVVLEAMKMELPVPAPANGVVVDVLVTPGDEVAAGQPIVVLQPDR